MVIPAIGHPFPWMFSLIRKREHTAKFPFSLSCLQVVRLFALFNPMKILSRFLAFASLASLACGIAFLLFSAPFLALLCFSGFALFGLAAVKLNPEI